MDVLLIGAGGLTGGRLLKLMDKKHKIYATYHHSTSIPQVLLENVSALVVNLQNVNTSILPDKIDVIFYLAQSNEYRHFPDGAEDMLNVNTLSPTKLIHYYSNRGLKQFIFASSGSVYTNKLKILEETDPIDPSLLSSYYAFSKYTTELALSYFKSLIPSIIIIRPFFIFGEEQNKSMLVPGLIEKINSRQSIKISGEKGFTFNPIYVEDAAIKLLELLNISGHHTINIAGDEFYFLLDFVKLISKIIGEEEVKITHNDSIAVDFSASNQYFNYFSDYRCGSIENNLTRMIEKYE